MMDHEKTKFVIDRNLTKDEVKMEMLSVLTHVAAFCEDNGLRYYLAWGTLLGAVRERGMIPWDYDVDIWMPRPDYEEFVDLYVKKNKVKKYELLSIRTNKKYYGNMMRVRNINTVRVSDVGIGEYEAGKSINLEIYPLDGMSSSLFEHIMYAYTMQFYKKLLNMKIARQHGRVSQNVIKRFLGNLILNITHSYTPRKLVLAEEHLRKRHEIKDSPLICYAPNNFIKITFGAMMSSKVLEDTVKLEFEGREYNAFGKYDYVLRHIYGDYMNPPDQKEIDRCVSMQEREKFAYRHIVENRA